MPEPLTVGRVPMLVTAGYRLPPIRQAQIGGGNSQLSAQGFSVDHSTA